MPRFKAYLKVLHPIYRESSGERLLWRDLAKIRGLRFHAEMNPELLFIPMPGSEFVDDLIGLAEGDLDDLTCRELVDALTPLTGPQTCSFEFGVLQNLNDPIFYKGRLADVTSCKRDLGTHCYPERWWPQDGSWCLFTDHDLSYTLVGGSAEVVNALSARNSLECVEVSAETRTRYAVDTDNLDRCWRQAAEALLSGSMSLWKAATLTTIMSRAEGRNSLATALDEFYSAVACYPHDHERDAWEPAALANRDREREEIEASYRDRIFAASRDLLSV